jgi:hypothetical protein
MTGDYDSVIGMNKAEPLHRFTAQDPVGKFEPASGPGDAVRRGGRDRRRERACDPDRAGAARRTAARGAAGLLGIDFSPARTYNARRISRQHDLVPEAAVAGHSQFKNIMHRKGRQDAIRSKLFGKLAREITVAAKMGLPDPP